MMKTLSSPMINKADVPLSFTVIRRKYINQSIVAYFYTSKSGSAQVLLVLSYHYSRLFLKDVPLFPLLTNITFSISRSNSFCQNYPHHPPTYFFEENTFFKMSTKLFSGVVPPFPSPSSMKTHHFTSPYCIKLCPYAYNFLFQNHPT